LFSQVPQSLRDEFIIKIAGTGEKLEECHNIAKRRSLNNVEFMGWLDQEAIQSVLLSSDIGLLPYPRDFDRQLSLPNKFCEYLVYGLPILTSLTGDVGSEIERTGVGLIYDPRNSRSLEVALRRFLDNEFLSTASRLARNAGQRYHSQIVYGEFAEYLECLVLQSRPGLCHATTFIC
jgi:glycosyltransferase involved in cell wall biosynthesis